MKTCTYALWQIAVVGSIALAAGTASVQLSAQTTQSASSAAAPMLSTPIVVQTMPPVPVHGGPWIPDTALSAKLDKSFDAGEYTLNPPSGFKSVTVSSPDGAGKVYNWTQPVRANGSQPTLTLAEASAPKGEESKYTAGDILENFVDSIRQNRTRWSASPAEKGRVGGFDFDFQRLYYNVVDNAKGYLSHGFVYVAEPTAGKFIIINGEDAEPYADTTFPILEDAALTIRPKGVAPPPGAPK